ncbi:MAG: hypothetical protein HY659_14565 [Rhizobiales bacterium]|nr:hypothetical protein [Hyphomicrobiales bacterium]
MPLSLYVFGAAAAIVATFFIIGVALRHAPDADIHPRVDLLAHPPMRWLGHPASVLAIKLAALGLFVITILAGFFGNQNPYQNIAPTLVWVIGWIGLVYVSAFAGDVWALINPWRAIFDGVDALCRRVHSQECALRLPYPEALGVWPSVALLFAFSWTELVYPDPAVPRHIATLATAYTILTLAGMFAFGRDAWLRHGEVFAVMFGTYARFAPTQAFDRERTPCLALRPFGVGLRDGEPASISMTAFVLLLLATVLYDGALTTPEWIGLESTLSERLKALGGLASLTIRTGGLAGFWLVFLGAYVAVSALMRAAIGGQLSTLEIARNFVFSLVPIAIGYHAAHYFVFLMVQGQYIVPLISDPFGYGWNLFGTAQYQPAIAIVGARFAWYTAVAAIVLGHIAAVYLAHIRAIQLFGRRSVVLRSQIPLTALMVVYTFVSLSILAEPLVERGTPVRPTAVTGAVIPVPEKAVLPDPAGGELRPVGPGQIAKVKLTYRVLGSAFHDGTRMTAADLMYAYSFAYRWSTRPNGDGAHYDATVDAATAAMRRRLVGLQVTGTDTGSKSFRVGDVNFVRELFFVDVYASDAPGDPERDAVIDPPWSTVPWHLLALMEEAVGRNWAAFSKHEAARRGIEWLDLVRSDQVKNRLIALVETFAREGYRPTPLRSLVSTDDARKRWTALAAFYKEHKHFLVSNGPYQLKLWSANSATLGAFRDLTYPLGVGSYDAYAIPRRGFITKTDWNGRRVTLSGDVESINKFQRSYRLDRTPIQAVSAPVLKRAAVECRYVVIDQESRVVLAGTARLGDDLKFHIDFNDRLPAGQYTMSAVIALNGNVMNAEIARIPVDLSNR